MKKIYTTLIAMLAIAHFSYAQTTNTFPLNGNVGIGTLNPTKLLDLRGEMRILSGGLNGSRIGSDALGFFISNDDAATPLFRLYGGSGNLQHFTVNSAGNVGIGTSSPGAKLEVNGGLNIRSATATPLSFLVSGWGTEYDATYNEGRLDIFKDGTGTAPNRSAIATFDLYHAYGNHSPVADGFLFKYRNLDVGGFAGGTNNVLMFLRGDGLVGIGTKSPDEKLTVNGKIHAKEVKIDTSIPTPDYVFNKDYALLSLTEVKNYIDKNHHLPEVPSAAEVEKEGLKLGEMNLILLKKIEELTLHLIEKDNQLKEQNTQLKEQNIQLIEQNKKLNEQDIQLKKQHEDINLLKQYIKK